MRKQSIALNSIWFSTDGCIPDSVINNLTQLAQMIKKSKFKKNYKIFFWTDKQKLNKNAKAILIKNKIIIYDYRKAFVKNKLSEDNAQNWIKQLVTLGNENHKIFFMLASDIFRFYILFKTFPAKFNFTCACYFDCNDINFNNLPNPSIFNKLHTIAFHFIEFNFEVDDVFKSLFDDIPEARLLLNNDVIIAKQHKKNHPLFEKIFVTYCRNLHQIRKDDKYLIELLSWTLNVMEFIDDALGLILFLITTHVRNVIYTDKNLSHIYLLVFFDKQLSLTPLFGIQNALDFFDFVRDREKGFVWIDRKDGDSLKAKEDDDSKQCRDFWHQLFVERYQLVEQKIA